MIEDPERDGEVPGPHDGRLRQWIDRLRGVERLFLRIAGVLTALVLVIGGAIALGRTVFGGDATKPSAKVPPTGVPYGSPAAATIAPTAPVPVVTESPAPPPAPGISVTCQLPGDLEPGQQTKATYTITSDRSVEVGLGLAVYDSGGTDHSSGDGDMDGFRLSVGTRSVSRDVFLPAGLDAGRYEIDAEIWPSGKIGAGGAEVLAEARCGYLSVS